MLDKETFEANRGQYLPRVYLKHLLDDGGAGVRKEGKGVSDLGYLKKRKDIPKEIRDLILGEITDPGFLSSKAYGQASRDMAILDFLGEVSQNQDWIFPESLYQWGDRTVTVQWLKAEADRIRKQARHMPPAKKPLALEIASDMDAAVDPILARLGKAPNDYRQVPDNARYGMLRGMWVRKEIYNDLIGGSQLLPADASIAEAVLGTGGAAAKATSLWKLSKVALNPPTQIRNFVSNAVLLNLSGTPLHRVPQRMVQAINSMVTNDKYWQVAKQYGVIGNTTFANVELLRIRKEFLDIKADSGNPIAILKKYAAAVGNAAGDVFQITEGMYKTAKIIDAMEGEGMDAEAAALSAHAALFDYSLVPKSVRYLRSAPVGMPFACVDEETEILTQRGWLTVDDLRVGDMCASFDMGAEHLEWKPVRHVHVRDYGGEGLHYIKDRHLDMALTPDHRCVTYRTRRAEGQRSTNGKIKSLEIVKAADLHTGDHIPTAAPFRHEPVGEPVSDGMVELVAWFVTEGTIGKTGTLTLSQNEGPDADRIAALIKSSTSPIGPIRIGSGRQCRS